MVIAASLIGVGGAALFIYRQMGNNVSVAKTTPNKNRGVTLDSEAPIRPALTPLLPETGGEHHAVIPTVADSTEWHFAEFSDQPRYIDVTYDGGRQHARLKVNTVLSAKPNIAASSSLVSDDVPETGQFNTPSNDPGSRYIVDKETGRIIGVDGSAGAAREVRRAQPVEAPVPSTTIRNPVPEVRVASPVLQYGRPLFDSDRPVQAAIPASQYLPSRKALPVNPDDSADESSPALADDASRDEAPVRRAKTVFKEPTAAQYDSFFERPSNTSIFRRDRSAD